MGRGEEILNQAVQQGKDFIKQSAKKLVRSLVTNPYFYIVLAIFLVIIVVAGSMIDVNSGPESNTNGYTNVGQSDFSGQELVTIAQNLHKFIQTNEYAYSCIHNVKDGYSNTCTCNGTSNFGLSDFERYDELKSIDCSAYVSWVLNQYLGDEKFKSRKTSHWFADEENWPSGWKKIDINDIQAGDILWKSGHVGIYIGSGKTVEAGSTRAIRSDYSFGSIQTITKTYTFGIRVQ